jgi:hypothetical protein
MFTSLSNEQEQPKKLAEVVGSAPTRSTSSNLGKYGIGLSLFLGGCRTKPYATVVAAIISPNNDGVQNVICQFVCDYRYRQFCNLENRLPL